MKIEDQTPATSEPVDDIDPIGPDRSLLIVDDDGPFLRRSLPGRWKHAALPSILPRR